MKIKEYKILKEIGAGGMGRILVASHPDLKTTVILKELRENTRDFSQRFRREAQIMMSLRHDNIAFFNDFFTHEGKKYIVMEHINGVPLSDIILKKKRIKPEAALLIMSEVVRGLAYAHAKNVLHRDLKPQNILISKKGEVKIIDFGIASSAQFSEPAGDETQTDLTVAGSVMGTPAYMSPEQLGNLKDVTVRSEIYTLGIILFEMLTGEKLFTNEISAQAMTDRLKDSRIAHKIRSAGLPVFFKKILLSCLRTNPSRRYRQVSVLQKKLDGYRKKMTPGDVQSSISAYVFHGKMADELVRMKPVYSSFMKSFRESRLRKNLLITVVTAVLASLISAGFIYTDLRYRVFARSSMGGMEIQYSLPLPRLAPLPDPKLEPALHAKRSAEARQKLHDFISQWYRDMLLDFRLRAWLIGLDGAAGKQVSAEEIILTPKNYVRRENDDFTIDLGDKSILENRLILSSPVLYRPIGSYAVKIQFNSKAYWTHFILDPVKKQKGIKLVETPYSDTPRSNVSFSFRFNDGITGRPVSNVRIFILQKTAGGPRWLDWEKLSAKKTFLRSLYNGQSYYFRFTHPDYDTGKNIKVYTSKDDRVVDVVMNFRPLH